MRDININGNINEDFANNLIDSSICKILIVFKL